MPGEIMSARGLLTSKAGKIIDQNKQNSPFKRNSKIKNGPVEGSRNDSSSLLQSKNDISDSIYESLPAIGTWEELIKPSKK